jgi:hypothetical protein
MSLLVDDPRLRDLGSGSLDLLQEHALTHASAAEDDSASPAAQTRQNRSQFAARNWDQRSIALPVVGVHSTLTATRVVALSIVSWSSRQSPILIFQKRSLAAWPMLALKNVQVGRELRNGSRRKPREKPLPGTHLALPLF